MVSEKEMSTFIRRAVEGDKDALGTVLESVRDMVFNLSLRMMGMIEDAEDATQEIMIRVMTSLSSFKGESLFSTWVYRIAKNYLVDYRRSRFDRQPLTFDFYARDIEQGMAERCPDPQSGVDAELLAEELKLSCTNVMLQCLDAESRCIYVLGAMFRIDSAMGADIFDTTPENYRQKLSRIRRQVNDFLKKYCGLSGSGMCACNKRLGYAVGQKRLNPARLEYSALEVCKKEMENMDALAGVFESLPEYRVPENARAFIDSLVASDSMASIQEAGRI